MKYEICIIKKNNTARVGKKSQKNKKLLVWIMLYSTIPTGHSKRTTKPKNMNKKLLVDFN